MADPFAALRTPLSPTDPDPGFAATLRTRLERALSLPRGVRMTAADRLLVPATPSDRTPSAAGTGRTPADLAATPTGRITPYLAVADARSALEFYAAAFGARSTSDPVVMPDGRIGHAELELAGAPVFLSDAHPEIGVVAPEPGSGATVTLHAEVDDVDVLTATAVAAGATLERAPADNPYGRVAVVRDPFGHRWMLNAPPRPAQRVREGDVVYASLQVPDVERAAAFFGAVLGWTYAPGSGPQGRQVLGPAPRHGLWGGAPRSTLLLCHAVDDLAAAVQRVRRSGGHAEEPVDRPEGRTCDCTDDQGMAFALFESSTGGEPRGPVNGARSGDLSYLTIGTTDSARFRTFFTGLFDWTFSPGSVPDGWQVGDVAPMTGLYGGEAVPVVQPMYRVDDIAGAVERVRVAGGTATEPSREPYGLLAECLDDQGTRFYLGQL